MNRLMHNPMPMVDGEVVIFFRGDHSYPIQLCGAKPTRDEVVDHVRLNPGTTSVESMGGEILWQEQPQ